MGLVWWMPQATHLVQAVHYLDKVLLFWVWMDVHGVLVLLVAIAVAHSLDDAVLH